MTIEIERKFLVRGKFPEADARSAEIIQGYLLRDRGRTVRIRMTGTRGFITVKGLPGESGFDRFEWEKEIGRDEAAELMKLCEPYIIRKTRYYIPYRGHTFEVDLFHDENEGLIIAEIELGSVDEEFDKPAWLGKEVSGDRRYTNSYLSANPFSRW